jgi:hypothetical protein
MSFSLLSSLQIQHPQARIVRWHDSFRNENGYFRKIISNQPKYPHARDVEKEAFVDIIIPWDHKLFSSEGSSETSHTIKMEDINTLRYLPYTQNIITTVGGNTPKTAYATAGASVCVQVVANVKADAEKEDTPPDLHSRVFHIHEECKDMSQINHFLENFREIMNTRKGIVAEYGMSGAQVPNSLVETVQPVLPNHTRKEVESILRDEPEQRYKDIKTLFDKAGFNLVLDKGGEKNRETPRLGLVGSIDRLFNLKISEQIVYPDDHPLLQEPFEKRGDFSKIT